MEHLSVGSGRISSICCEGLLICRKLLLPLLSGFLSTRARACILSGLALCGSATSFAAKSKARLPDWVLEAAAEKLPEYPSKTGAVVLLYDVDYTVNNDGRTTEHVRQAWKILRPQAAKDIGQVGTWYSKQSGNKPSLHAWSIAPDGMRYAIEDKDVSDVDVHESFELYSDDRMLVATVPAAETGSIVAMEYEREGKPYVGDYHWYAQDNYPVRKARLTLRLPQGYTYKAVWKGSERTQSRDLEKGRTLWEMENLPAVDVTDIPLSPSPHSLYSRLDIHYSGSGMTQGNTGGTWQGIGEWFEVLAKGRNDSNNAIAAKAKELVAGKADFADRAQAIAEYVQQHIRYVAVEVGVGGYQPHSAADIFSHEYGDCKDKATLLSAMLKAVGIRSTWVLVDTNRGAIDPDAPSTAGNHMIAAIEVPEGYNSKKFFSVVKTTSGKRYLIFDPTWEKTPFGQLESELQGSYGLLIDGNESQVVKLPVLSPDINLIRRTASFHLDENGDLKGTVIETRAGDIASDWRYIYTHGTEQEQEDVRQRMLGHDLTSFHVANLKVENAGVLLKNLTVTYSLEADNFSQRMGPLLMVRPRVLGTTGYHLDHKQRTIPIDLEDSKLVQDEFEIELPKGYAVDELPRPIKVDMGFAAYESESDVKDGKLHYKRSFTVRDITLPATRYHDLQELAGVIEADEQNTAILKKVN